MSPIGLQASIDSRKEVMLVRARIDYRYCYMYGLKPGERMCFNDFRHHGILLPFGSLNAHLNTANRLLLDPICGWTKTDSSDPLCGWNMNQVAASGQKYKVSPQDHYGTLLFHSCDLLKKFLCNA